MLKTSTGEFPIGVRRGWSEWQRDLPALAEWLTSQSIGVIDLGNDGEVTAPIAHAAGLQIGSADAKDWSGLISADPVKRQAARDANAAMMAVCAPLGVRNYFIVMLPEDPTQTRFDNHKLAVTGLQEFAPILAEFGGRLAIEGWPGPGALACTPDGYRALISEVDSPTVGINYDPSHLLRMGIDPIRFVEEFGEFVVHVHGKDTEIMTDEMYEFGTEISPTLGKAHGFGGMHWRYTIPGHGIMRWTAAFEILESLGYDGAVSIELEDERFNGTTETEQSGISIGAWFLASA